MSDYSTHRYENMDRGKVDALLRALRQNGAAVSGDNPWEVDTHLSGVKLRGRLNEECIKFGGSGRRQGLVCPLLDGMAEDR